jgi:transcriptional regulator with XRE-family HTH domain
MGMAYGEWLKDARGKAGLTQQELADSAIMTRSHIAHIEAGRRWPSEDDAKRLDAVLKTGNVLSSFLPTSDRRPVGPHFETARQLEQQATMVREFALSFVPGMLQTEAYAHAVLRGAAYPPLSRTDRDRAVATRLERSCLLEDPVTPIVWALLDEAVLRRPVGGPHVMAEKLTYLADMGDRDRIRLHVLPFGVGVHPLLQSMVTLMWFEDQPPIAYVEGLHTGKVHDSPALVERIRGAYDLALGDALPLKESLALLRATAKDYGHADH